MALLPTDIAASLRISTLTADPPLQASRWQRLQVLLSPEDLDLLLADLANPTILLTGRFYPLSAFNTHLSAFKTFYRSYIDTLRQGLLPSEEQCRQLFSAILTATLQPLYLLNGPHNEYLLRTSLPVIQLQHHSFSYSPLDNQVRSMVYGQETIFWGLQFSYPNLYIDPITKAICQTTDDAATNSSLFKQLQRWLRHHTIPTSFLATDSRCNSSIRMSPSCLSWLPHHPQLQQQQLVVYDTLQS